VQVSSGEVLINRERRIRERNGDFKPSLVGLCEGGDDPDNGEHDKWVEF